MNDLASQKKSNELAIDEVINLSVREYKCFERKTAESFLEMGRVVFEAKKNLCLDSDFDEFCNRIGQTSSSSTIKKMKIIGENYVHLKEISSNLPSNWTSIYQICRLSEYEIDEYVHKGLIHPNVKGSEIKNLLIAPPIPNSKMREVQEVQEVREVNCEECLEELAEESFEIPNKKVQNGTKFDYHFECEISNLDDAIKTNKIKKIIRDLVSLNVTIRMSRELNLMIYPVAEAVA